MSEAPSVRCETDPLRQSAGAGFSVRGTGDPLGRYYSLAPVARIVVECASCSAPASVLDLASGDGILGAAAAARWPSSSILAVDIDPAAGLAAAARGLPFVAADCLSTGFLPLLAVPGGYHLVVSNPPFRRQSWLQVHSDIFGDAGFVRSDLPPGGASLEAVFALRALDLCRPGGSVVLVLSDGFACGRSWKAARRILAAGNRIDAAVQLPAGSFRGTEARAVVVALTKGCQQNRPVRLRRMEAGGDLSPVIEVDIGAAMHRLDYAFHEAAIAGSACPSLRDLGGQIVRGSFQTGAGMPEGSLFHTRDFPRGAGRIGIQLPAALPAGGAPRSVSAEAGDILIARLGRSLERKVCLVGSGTAYPTSAVFRVRLDSGIAREVAKALISEEGARRLAATARGTSALMLGREDLMGMPLPMPRIS